MKKIFLTAILVLFAASLMAQSAPWFKGSFEEAKAEAEEFLKKEPDYSLENEKTVPYKDPSQFERWTEDLRKAGFPE